jgi:small GTP-binding protein
VNWWQRLRARFAARRAPALPGEGDPLQNASESLRALLEDPHTPREVRDALAADYEQVRAMLDKLERGDLHLAVFGRVSVGKSSLANALLGRDEFEVGVLHGTTRVPSARAWREVDRAGVHLFDTPGIDELDGEAREQLAHEIATRADLVLFACDADLTETELSALRVLADERRPLLLVLNKADRYTEGERATLLAALRERAAGLVLPENVLPASARPAPQRVVRVGADGRETEAMESRGPDVAILAERLVAVLAAEGRTLAALNAALFAGRLSDAVGGRIAELRAEIAERVINGYCLAKGMAVGLNPVPVADIVAAAALDVSLVLHLARVYQLPITRSEAGSLIATITGTLAALLGVVWGAHVLSSMLKGVSAGLSTVITAGAQGALAWYATLLVGRAAQRWLAQGKSWGELGPKRVVSDIVASLDRDSVLREAREEILRRLRGAPA